MPIKRILSTLIAMLCLSATSACAQTPEERFREEMTPRLAKALPGATLTAKTDDPLAIMVKGGHLDGGQINLNRIYGYCLTAEATDCESQKQALIAAVAIKPESATLESLRLIVRGEDYVDWIRGEDAKDGRGSKTILKPLGGGLYAILAYRMSNGVGSVTTDTLKDLNLTDGNAWAIAQKQTTAIMPAMPTIDQLNGGLVLYQGHALGSSLLADLPAWSKLATSAGPDLVVAPVSDEMVLVGVMHDGPDIEKLQKTAQDECSQQPRCISPKLYRLRGGQWAVVGG